ncbi:MAG: hypothetical protein PHI98_05230 [Eubacteriales bacterium]|nr:hypothetical protein [Eubacteriales bacterium]
MPIEIYEIVAQGARYWFLFLMALIVWRSYRWFVRDRRQRKKRMRLLPDAGYIGEMVVIDGGDELQKGAALPIPREGTLGRSRMNDLCLPLQHIKNKHCWFCYDREEGLRMEPYHGCTIAIDGEERTGRRDPLYMQHGSRLTIGGAELRLRMFAGFETALRPSAQPTNDENGAPQAAPAIMTQEQFAQWQAQQMQQQYIQQMTYLQWMAQQQAIAAASTAAPASTPSGNPSPLPPTAPESDGYEPSDEPIYDASSYAPPGPSRQIEFDHGMNFYPPTDSEEDPWPYAPNPDAFPMPEEEDFYAQELDEDLTDAAAPPKSAYVGHDESEAAKKAFWDRYLGGGEKR